MLLPCPAFLPKPGSTVGGRDSPSYSGFFHCLAAFDNKSSSCFDLGSLLPCTGPNNLSTGLLSCAAFSLTCMTVYLLVYPLRGSLKFISCPNTYIPHTKHDQIPSPNKINYPNVLFLGSSLFIYLSIHQPLPVAHHQLSSSTMSVLLTLHLSCQHITAYLHQ